MQILTFYVGVASATLYAGIASITQLQQLDRSILCDFREVRNPRAYRKSVIFNFKKDDCLRLKFIGE